MGRVGMATSPSSSLRQGCRERRPPPIFLVLPFAPSVCDGHLHSSYSSVRHRIGMATTPSSFNDRNRGRAMATSKLLYSSFSLNMCDVHLQSSYSSLMDRVGMATSIKKKHREDLIGRLSIPGSLDLLSEGAHGGSVSRFPSNFKELISQMFYYFSYTFPRKP